MFLLRQNAWQDWIVIVFEVVPAPLSARGLVSLAHPTYTHGVAEAEGDGTAEDESEALLEAEDKTEDEAEGEAEAEDD